MQIADAELRNKSGEGFDVILKLAIKADHLLHFFSRAVVGPELEGCGRMRQAVPIPVVWDRGTVP